MSAGRRLAVLLAACAMAFRAAPAAAPAPEGSPAPVMTQKDAEDAVAKVLPGIETIRGLKFRKSVPVRVVGDAGARDYVTQRVRALVTEAEIAAQQDALRLLGLLPPGTDMLESYLDVLGEQAGGFYSPEDKVFFLLDDMPPALGPLLAAHELTHALEDQHYDLDARLRKVKDDDDAVFARSAVHEGSATLVMAVYMAQRIDDGALKRAEMESLATTEAGRAEKLGAMPAVLRRQLLGPYVLGMAFLMRGEPERLGAAGFPVGDVATAYRTGPASSEQILHPEKFWDPAKRDPPRRVELPRLATLLAPGWRRRTAGVLGELTLGTLVGAPTPEGPLSVDAEGSWTNAAASGWGGDRWELWTDGTRAFVALATEWDTVADAAEFADALPTRPGLAWRREGTRVAVVAGEPPGSAAPILRALAPQPGR